MRIAPKPLPGQEVSLDSILQSSPRQLARDMTLSPDKIVIMDCGDYWRLSPIKLRRGLFAYDLWKGFLEESSEKPLQEWIEYSKDAYKNKRFIACAGDVLFSILDFLYGHLKDPNYGHSVEAPWEFLGAALKRKAGRPYRPWLLTTIAYGSKLGNDIVTHDIGLITGHRNLGEIHTRTKVIDKDNASFTRIALGCPNSQYVCEVLQALVGQEPNCVSYEEVSGRSFERGLVIGLDHDYLFNVNASADMDTKRPALGVFRRATFSEETP